MKHGFNISLVPKVLIGIILFVVGLFSLEALIYPHLIENLISIQVEIIALLSLFGLGVTVAAYQFTPSNRFMINLALATCLATIVSIVFYYLENAMYANIIFSRLHLHPSVVREMALYLWATLGVLSLPFILKQKTTYIYLLPLAGLFFLFFLRITFVTSFIEIGVENGLVEWLTFIFFVIATFMAARLSFRYWKAKQYFYAFVLATIAASTLFLAGEEIAWGEFALQFKTSDFFLTHNVQQETTLHNLVPVQQVMWYGYIFIGIVDGILLFFKNRLQQMAPIFSLLPEKQLTTYFLPMLIYGLNRLLTGPIYYKTWEESVELIFSIGVLLYVHHFANLQRVKLKNLT